MKQPICRSGSNPNAFRLVSKNEFFECHVGHCRLYEIPRLRSFRSRVSLGTSSDRLAVDFLAKALQCRCSGFFWRELVMKKRMSWALLVAALAVVSSEGRHVVAQQRSEESLASRIEWKGSDVAPSKIGGLGGIAKSRTVSALALTQTQELGGIAKIATPGAAASFAQVKERAQSYVNAPFSVIPLMFQFEIESSKIGRLGEVNRTRGSSLGAVSRSSSNDMNGLAPLPSTRTQLK
jgi:hypothetical protein